MTSGSSRPPLWGCFFILLKQLHCRERGSKVRFWEPGKKNVILG